jgi:mono/diheme cytochrome c family protein
VARPRRADRSRTARQEETPVTRVSLNVLIDTVAAALVTAMVATGYVLAFVLPPGTNRTHWLWGLLRHEWGALHAWVSVGLLGVLAIHTALHWRWLVGGLCRRLGRGEWAERAPRLSGLVVLGAAAAPLVVLVAAAHLSVRPLDRPLHPLTDAPAAAADPAARPDRALLDRVSAVLQARCATCHGAREPAAGVRAESPAALLAQQDGVRWVVAGAPDASPLLRVVGVPSATRRITPKHGLTEDEVELLRAWIASLPR